MLFVQSRINYLMPAFCLRDSTRMKNKLGGKENKAGINTFSRPHIQREGDRL